MNADAEQIKAAGEGALSALIRVHLRFSGSNHKIMKTQKLVAQRLECTMAVCKDLVHPPQCCYGGRAGANGAGRNEAQLDTPTTRSARGAERGSPDPQRVGRFAGAAGRETCAPVRAGGSAAHSSRCTRLRACAEKLAGCSRRRKEADFYARNSRPFRLLTSAHVFRTGS